MEKRKPTIFLAGDSTVQSYGKERAPLTGWGMALHEYFQEKTTRRAAASDSRFEQAVLYETDGVFIDNRAMAGRSCRSFFDEGRLDDIENSMREGDYLFAQFAHNDANKAKEERYVTPDQYEDYLLRYDAAAMRHKAQLVLVTAIAMRSFGDGEDRVYDVGEKVLKQAVPEAGKEIPEKKTREAHGEGYCEISFPEYRDRMLSMAQKYDIPLLDLGLATAKYCSMLGPEKTKEIFLWTAPGEYPAYPEGKEDNAHLKLKGAEEFARILAGLIAGWDKDARLDALKRWLAV